MPRAPRAIRRRRSRFIAQGRKMILYHGASDPSIPASQSIALYRELAEQQQGMDRTRQQNVRLFLAPAWTIAGAGSGPDQFDTRFVRAGGLVEHGKAPEAIQASTKPSSPVKHRSAALPLLAAFALPRHGRGSMTPRTGVAWRRSSRRRTSAYAGFPSSRAKPKDSRSRSCETCRRQKIVWRAIQVEHFIHGYTSSTLARHERRTGEVIHTAKYRIDADLASNRTRLRQMPSRERNSEELEHGKKIALIKPRQSGLARPERRNSRHG